MNLRAAIVSQIFLALAVVATPAAHAEQRGVYVGASAGGTDIDESGGFSDSQAAGKLLLGIRPSRGFWAEAAYVYLNEAEDTFNGTKGTVEIDGFTFSLHGGYSIQDTLLYVKGGVYVWEADSTLPGLVADSADGEDLFWGLGLNYTYNDHFSFRGEWERYEMGDFNEDLLSVGVTYSF